MSEATYNCKVMPTITNGVKVRPDPSTANATDIKMSAGTSFQISEIVPDRLDPTNAAKKWGHIFGGIHDGKYVALEYPGNPIPICSYTAINATPQPTPDKFSVEFVLSELGLIDAIKIYGPANPSINILYNDVVIAGL
jgi:hypothetical protein